jgi:hypothetical protein
MKHRTKTLLAAALITTASHAALAGEDNTLFNPTPDDKMRPMTTERPSKTDSPYSLDAGHFQIETNLFATVHNDDCIGGTCAETRQNFLGGATNLRIGLTDNTDFQIISDVYRHLTVNDKTAGSKTTREGFGDTQLRLKVNVIGNDPASKFSLGVIPYVKVPTNQDDLGNDKYEGGIGLPFNINFDGGWSLGGMTQLNFINQLDNSGYDPAYANSVIVGKSLTDKLSAYGEFYTFKADQSGAKWANTLDFGTVYAVTDNFKIDANIAVGASDAADDTNFFVGAAYRF